MSAFLSSTGRYRRRSPISKPAKTRVLQRVTWAESDDNTQMIPGRTEFLTVGKPATPEELLHWLTGTTLANL